MSGGPVHIVFDIGGTNMRVAAARGREVGEIRKEPTPYAADDMVRRLVVLADEVAGSASIDAIAGGIPGVLADGVFAYEPPHLDHWVGMPFTAELEKRLGVPARATNDVGLVGLGEAHMGAGQGSRIMAYVTVSTGVNGARITDGAIDRTTYGFEIGHQIIPDGELESLISGTAVRKKFGIDPKDLGSIPERNLMAEHLAAGLYNSVLHWSPDTIVLGGSMITGTNPIPLERTKDALAQKLTMYPSPPIVKMATLGDRAGLIGAAIVAEGLAS